MMINTPRLHLQSTTPELLRAIPQENPSVPQKVYRTESVFSAPPRPRHPPYLRWSQLLYRLRAIFRRKSVDAELDAELQFHIQLQTESNGSIKNRTYRGRPQDPDREDAAHLR